MGLCVFSESFRCGMFYSPPTVGDKPRAKIFILPKRFKIEKSTFEVIKDLDWTGGTCDTLKDGQPDDSMDQYCYTLVRLFLPPPKPEAEQLRQ